MVYVMSDIHGQYDLFLKMLRIINFNDKDTLFILGDVIDRGPKGIETLDKIIQSKNMHMLLGNHELMMLDYLDERAMSKWNALLRWAGNGCRPTLDGFTQCAPPTQMKMLRYLRDLPVEYQIKVNGREYILCHAQPCCGSFAKNPMERAEINTKYTDETEFSVWHRPRIDDENFQNKTIICGHTPVSCLGGRNTIIHSAKRIYIDCGCANISAPYYGRLGCLRLNDMREFYCSPANMASGAADEG